MSWPEEHTFKYRMCLFVSMVYSTHYFLQRSRLQLRRHLFRLGVHSMGRLRRVGSFMSPSQITITFP